MQQAAVVAALTRFMTALGLPSSAFEFYHDGRQFLERVHPFSVPEYLSVYAERLRTHLAFPAHEHAAFRVAATICAPNHPAPTDPSFEILREAMRTVWLRAIPGHFNMILDLAEAYMSGLWLIGYMHDTVPLCPSPYMKFEALRLHNADGPALWWEEGPFFYFWRGIQIDGRVITAPESLTAKDITGVENVEVRRVWIEALGARVLEILVPKLLHKDHTGELYHLTNADDIRPYIAVKLVDPSTGREYLKRVPPTMRKAQDAVAWTFEMPAHLWNLTKES